MGVSFVEQRGQLKESSLQIRVGKYLWSPSACETSRILNEFKSIKVSERIGAEFGNTRTLFYTLDRPQDRMVNTCPILSTENDTMRLVRCCCILVTSLVARHKETRLCFWLIISILGALMWQTFLMAQEWGMNTMRSM